MNLSLKRRVGICFIIANAVTLAIMFVAFHFLNNLNSDIGILMDKSNQLMVLTDEVRLSAVKVLRYQRNLLSVGTEENINKLKETCDGFRSQLSRLDAHYKDEQINKAIARMSTYVESLSIILSKASFMRGDSGSFATLSDLADKILESFTEFQSEQNVHSRERNMKINEIIRQTKRNMMITLIIGFLGTILLLLIIPGKIALPFKKINDAIRELQDCNFDVSIYYNQDDEIGEIAREMNKMIMNMKKFEELRSDRINVELRKFDILANLVKKPVLVANAESRLIYMNSKLYELLNVQSDDVLTKNMSETVLPQSIVEAFDLAIKRRSKIENAEILILRKTNTDDDEGETEEETVFEGYANVIPIRGKDSSLDYYLMVMSNDVFA